MPQSSQSVRPSLVFLIGFVHKYQATIWLTELFGQSASAGKHRTTTGINS